MSIPYELKSALKENGGLITAAQANEIGISNERLRLLVQSGDLKRLSTGIYAFPDEFFDKMYIAQLRRQRIVYSHETALFLHGLTDRDPINYMVTVPTGYNPTRLHKEGFTVFTIKRELHEIGQTKLPTMFGNYVTTYDMERTICDCLRSRSNLDIAVVTDAIKRYVKRKDKNLNKLMQLAEIFKVSKLLRNYLEVLL